MRPNFNLMKATLTGALGGLLFGFDTVVISGAIDALVKLYGLTDYGKGWTVAIALIGTVIGALGAGVIGQKLGGRETLRLTAMLYVLSAIGSALAWNWPSLMVFRLIGGLGIGASSVLGPVYIAELAPAKWRGRLVGAFQFNVVLGNPRRLHVELSDPPAPSRRQRMALAGRRRRGTRRWIPCSFSSASPVARAGAHQKIALMKLSPCSS
jgi:hypothetical protein